MANDTTDCRASGGAQNAAAQHVACNATNDSAGGDAYFLGAHARASAKRNQCNRSD
jgi:hypothetical protein